MSENVDLVHSIFAEWERGDFSSSEWAHPDLELVIADGPTPGSWRGLRACAGAWRDLLSAWTDMHPEAEEYRELDAGRVFILAHFCGYGKTSGLDLDQITGGRGAALFHVRDGKVTRHVVYLDRGRAMADLGLAE
jgi:ketosteroid isomerase-like protein